MAGSKHFDKIAWIITALTLVIAILFMNGAALGVELLPRTLGYETRLFDNTRVHTVNIVMDNWDELIENATAEEYYPASIVIDGEAYKNVGIRGKGNTSLSNVASMGSERYSFKIEFDHYDSTLSYYGLDKLCLNNLIQDSTMMKDYLVYTMMQEFGVNAPLCSFVYITVNGEDWGLYLAVEGVEDGFLTRNYGADAGNLYKPDSMSFGGGRGNGKDFRMDDFLENMDFSALSEFVNSFDFTDLADLGEAVKGGFSGFGDMTEPGDFSGFGGGMGGISMGSSDVKLQYIDDDADSYSNIWDNAKTKITDADKTRLIDSLKKLSAAEDIESVVDVEQVLRYFVVHNYVCNGDSYTGSMVHNYYLYEKDGQLAMIPWDYNLAFGTFTGGSAQSSVNTPIDSPISGGASDDRPMWSWILSDESYTEQYHALFAEFLNTVDVQQIIDDAYLLIQPYVEKDPTKFYTAEEFETGVATLSEYCALRTESITAQLANGSTVETMAYADASGVNLNDMGSMSTGGEMPNMGGEMPNMGGEMPNTGGGMPNMGGEMPDMSGGMPDMGGEMPNMNGEMPSTGGEMPDMGGGMPDMGGEIPNMGGEMPNMGGEMPDMGGEMPNMGGETSNTDGTEMPDAENPDSTGGVDNAMPGNGSRPGRDDSQRQDGNFSMDRIDVPTGSTVNSAWIWLAVSVLILGAGLIVAKLYR